MSNQRRGKWKPAAMNDNTGMRLTEFFKRATEVLNQYGHDDAAFYFEMCEEWLREGKTLNPNDAAKILGV